MVDLSGECRVLFKKNFQKELFDILVHEKSISLKDLSRILDVNYWTLKKWRSGKYNITGTCLRKLIKFCPICLRKGILGNIIEIKKDGWGRKIGYINAISKCSKKELKERMVYVRNFKRRKIIKLDFNEDLCEVIGILMGDGCLSKYFSKYDSRFRHEITITGHIYDDNEYYENYVIPLISKIFEVRPTPRRRPTENVIRIHISNKPIFRFLHSIGLPIGKKINELKFTNRMLKLSKEHKFRIIRGLFDTDGNLSARKDENYKYPYFKITTKSDILREQLKNILRKNGFPTAYIHSNDVMVRGKNNSIKWMKEIGSSHPIHNKRFNIWITSGRLEPKYMGSSSNGRTLPSQIIWNR